jgi:hypothetical protein
VFGDLFLNEPIPTNGYLDIGVLDKPGFGLELNPNARLVDATGLLGMRPQKSLTLPVEKEKVESNGAQLNGDHAPSEVNGSTSGEAV